MPDGGTAPVTHVGHAMRAAVGAAGVSRLGLRPPARAAAPHVHAGKAASTPSTTLSRALLRFLTPASGAARIPGAAPRWLAAPAPRRRSLATQSASGPAAAEPPPDPSLSPSSFEVCHTSYILTFLHITRGH